MLRAVAFGRRPFFIRNALLHPKTPVQPSPARFSERPTATLRRKTPCPKDCTACRSPPYRRAKAAPRFRASPLLPSAVRLAFLRTQNIRPLRKKSALPKAWRAPARRVPIAMRCKSGQGFSRVSRVRFRKNPSSLFPVAFFSAVSCRLRRRDSRPTAPFHSPLVRLPSSSPFFSPRFRSSRPLAPRAATDAAYQKSRLQKQAAPGTSAPGTHRRTGINVTTRNQACIPG